MRLRNRMKKQAFILKDWFMDKDEAHNMYKQDIKELKQEIKEKQDQLYNISPSSQEYEQIEDDIYRAELKIQELEKHLKNNTKREGPNPWDPNVMY